MPGIEACRPTAPDDVDCIDLWLAFEEDATDPELLRQLRPLLSEQERLQEGKFVFDPDRKRYLLTRALVRTVLSRYAPVRPEAWSFSTNRYGRPAIDKCHHDSDGLDFNVSHTAGLVVVGVTRQHALGVDIEDWTGRSVTTSLARHCFTADEFSALMAAPAPSFQDHFFQYWTFKEAYIKARGMGLSIPLDRFSFHYPCQATVVMTAAPDIDPDASAWHFEQFRPSPRHLLAVCSNLRPDGCPPRIRLRQVVPTVGEWAWPLQSTRRSVRTSRCGLDT